MSRCSGRIFGSLINHSISQSVRTSRFQCFQSRIYTRTFTTQSNDTISVSQVGQSAESTEKSVKKRTRRTTKPKLQPFTALIYPKTVGSVEASAEQQPDQPKRKRGRPRKQPVDQSSEQTSEQSSSATQPISVDADTSASQSSTPIVKKSVIPRRRVIRKPQPFEHTPRAPFGIQDVLTLLYTYLPNPSTRQSVTESSLPHPVQIYDVHSKSVFNNFVITVFCTSARQMSYLAQAVYKLARARDACPLNKSTLSLERHKATDWQMVDMGPILLHVFNTSATITQPSLDYHPLLPEPVVQRRSRRFSHEEEYEDREPQVPEQESVSVVLQRHPVVDAIEKQFGDCIVPVERHLSVTDYIGRLTDEEGDHRIAEVQ